MHYVLLLLAVACGTPSPSTTPSDPSSGGSPKAPAGSRSDIDIAGLEKALAEGAPLIDVRTEGEFAAGHVPGAINLPLGFDTAAAPIQALDSSKPVYLICQSGGRSGRAADQLAAAGFHAVNVTGGTGKWQASGREIAH